MELGNVGVDVEELAALRREVLLRVLDLHVEVPLRGLACLGSVLVTGS